MACHSNLLLLVIGHRPPPLTRTFFLLLLSAELVPPSVARVDSPSNRQCSTKKKRHILSPDVMPPPNVANTYRRPPTIYALHAPPLPQPAPTKHSMPRRPRDRLLDAALLAHSMPRRRKIVAPPPSVARPLRALPHRIFHQPCSMPCRSCPTAAGGF